MYSIKISVRRLLAELCSYCVRPNSGRIEPGRHVEVQGWCLCDCVGLSDGPRDNRSKTVLLQAMKEDPPLDAKCKDKFLVQSVAITGDLEYSNITSIVRPHVASVRDPCAVRAS